MITFSFHMHYYTTLNNKHRKDQGGTFICKADTSSEEWIQTESCTFIRQHCIHPTKVTKNQLPDNNEHNGFVPTVNQQIGEQIYSRKPLWIGEASLKRIQPDYKQRIRRKNKTQNNLRQLIEIRSFESGLPKRHRTKRSDIFLAWIQNINILGENFRLNFTYTNVISCKNFKINILS